jgi:hypothetical protein
MSQHQANDQCHDCVSHCLDLLSHNLAARMAAHPGVREFPTDSQQARKEFLL